ncbi:MAG: hypothetical protein AB1466_00625 [Actinomycetota bacterium]
MDIKGEVDKLMRKIRRGRIPSSETIVKETFEELGFTPDVLKHEDIQQNFNKLLSEVFIKTLEVLERYEDRAYARHLIDELMTLRSEDLQKAQEIVKKAKNLDQGFKEAVRILFEK